MLVYSSEKLESKIKASQGALTFTDTQEKRIPQLISRDWLDRAWLEKEPLNSEILVKASCLSLFRHPHIRLFIFGGFLVRKFLRYSTDNHHFDLDLTLVIDQNKISKKEAQEIFLSFLKDLYGEGNRSKLKTSRFGVNLKVNWNRNQVEKIQFVTNFYDSVEDLLDNNDLSLTAIAYEPAFDRYYLTPACLRSLQTRMIELNFEKNAVNVNTVYRMVNYLRRGFCFLLPDLDLDNLENFLLDSQFVFRGLNGCQILVHPLSDSSPFDNYFEDNNDGKFFEIVSVQTFYRGSHILNRRKLPQSNHHFRFFMDSFSPSKQNGDKTEDLFVQILGHPKGGLQLYQKGKIPGLIVNYFPYRLTVRYKGKVILNRTRRYGQTEILTIEKNKCHLFSLNDDLYDLILYYRHQLVNNTLPVRLLTAKLFSNSYSLVDDQNGRTSFRREHLLFFYKNHLMIVDWGQSRLIFGPTLQSWSPVQNENQLELLDFKNNFRNQRMIKSFLLWEKHQRKNPYDDAKLDTWLAVIGHCYHLGLLSHLSNNLEKRKEVFQLAGEKEGPWFRYLKIILSLPDDIKQIILNHLLCLPIKVSYQRTLPETPDNIMKDLTPVYDKKIFFSIHHQKLVNKCHFEFENYLLI